MFALCRVLTLCFVLRAPVTSGTEEVTLCALVILAASLTSSAARWRSLERGWGFCNCSFMVSLRTSYFCWRRVFFFLGSNSYHGTRDPKKPKPCSLCLKHLKYSPELKKYTRNQRWSTGKLKCCSGSSSLPAFCAALCWGNPIAPSSFISPTVWDVDALQSCSLTLKCLKVWLLSNFSQAEIVSLGFNLPKPLSHLQFDSCLLPEQMDELLWKSGNSWIFFYTSHC